MIKQLAHVCIYTNDLESTTHFYTQALGMKRGFEFIKDGNLFGYYLEIGHSTFIEVFEGEPPASGNIDHLALEVDDMDATRDTILKHGYEVTEKKLGTDHSWQSWVKDPNGVSIELHEYTPDSLQLKGGTCLVNW